MQDVSQLTGGSPTAGGLPMEDFFKVAPGLCLYLSNPHKTCGAVKDKRWQRETHQFIRSTAAQDVQGDDFINATTGLDRALRGIERHLRIMDGDQVCGSASSLTAGIFFLGPEVGFTWSHIYRVAVSFSHTIVNIFVKGGTTNVAMVF